MAEDLAERAKAIRLRFDSIVSTESAWQKKLRTALVRSTELSLSLSEMSLWLDRLDRKLDRQLPVDVLNRKTVLMTKFNRFKVSPCVLLSSSRLFFLVFNFEL